MPTAKLFSAIRFGACEDLAPTRRIVVYSGDERVPMGYGIEAMSLGDLARQLAVLAG